ncbi:uncharacterized protein WM277_019453 [Molossus nigricans]
MTTVLHGLNSAKTLSVLQTPHGPTVSVQSALPLPKPKSPHCSTCGMGQVAPNVGLQHGGSSEGHRSSGRQKGKEKRERRGNLLRLHPSGMDRKAEILLLGMLLHLCLLVEGGFGASSKL